MKSFFLLSLIMASGLALSFRVVAGQQTPLWANEKGIFSQAFVPGVIQGQGNPFFRNGETGGQPPERWLPQDRASSRTDLATNLALRTDILAQEDLSAVDDENVEIITEYGKVTLRGSVKTIEEKQSIYESALNLVGPDNIDDQLKVVPSA